MYISCRIASQLLLNVWDLCQRFRVESTVMHQGIPFEILKASEKDEKNDITDYGEVTHTMNREPLTQMYMTGKLRCVVTCVIGAASRQQIQQCFHWISSKMIYGD